MVLTPEQKRTGRIEAGGVSFKIPGVEPASTLDVYDDDDIRTVLLEYITTETANYFNKILLEEYGFKVVADEELDCAK